MCTAKKPLKNRQFDILIYLQKPEHLSVLNALMSAQRYTLNPSDRYVIYSSEALSFIKTGFSEKLLNNEHLMESKFPIKKNPQINRPQTRGTNKCAKEN